MVSVRQTRRAFLRGTGAAALAAAAGCRPSAGSRRGPNILLILSDDQGYGDLGCYGAEDLRTPCIDRLAAEGVRFSQYYAASAECTPTRTALMTGRYLHRVGGLECAIGTGNVGRYDDAIRLAERHDLGLPTEHASIARVLKDGGYATAMFGKWHLGYEDKFLPRRHGFDHFLGVLGGNCDYFHHCEVDGRPVLYENESPVRRDGYLTDLITDEAAAFLRSRPADRPFFLYVAYTAPHSPYQGPGDRTEAPVPKEQWESGTRAKYVEMVEHMDRCIGRLLEVLRRQGLDGQTLVIFASDNGAAKVGSNAPFSGHKTTLYEGGVRVPCVVRWPGVLPAARVTDQVAITMDLTASMAAAAGCQDVRFDGIDVLGRLARREAEVRRTLFWRFRRAERTWRAVRDGNLKYISLDDGAAVQEWLFDLAADPAEKNDLLGARPDDARRLKGLLAGWEVEVRHTRGRQEA